MFCLTVALAAAGAACADTPPAPVALGLSRGLNLLSVPVRPEAAGLFDAAALLQATGADWVVRLASSSERLATTALPRFVPYFPGHELPAFPIRGDETYLLHLSVPRTWVLTGQSWPESTLAGQLAGSLGSIGAPAGCEQLDFSGLLELTGANGGLMTENGRFRLLSATGSGPATSPGWWVVRPAQGSYLLPRRDAVDESPSLTLPAEVFAAPGQLIELQATASDREWGQLRYSWLRTAGPPALLSASRTHVAIEYGGPVGIGGPMATVRAKRARELLVGKDEPISHELREASLKLDAMPRCRVEVKDERGDPLPNVPIRFVTRRSQPTEGELLEFLPDVGNTRDGVATSGSRSIFPLG